MLKSPVPGAHFSKKCGELIVVLLRPFFAWMMMTPCALHADPQENLAHKTTGIRWIAFVTQNSHRAVLVELPSAINNSLTI